jgi:hypothetical protein
MRTVHFPAPGQGLSQAPVTIQRDFAPDTGAGASAAASAPAPAAGNAGSDPAAAPGAGPGGEKKEELTPDQMYDYILERLRRDLVVEREQLGHLIIDNP